MGPPEEFKGAASLCGCAQTGVSDPAPPWKGNRTLVWLPPGCAGRDTRSEKCGGGDADCLWNRNMNLIVILTLLAGESSSLVKLGFLMVISRSRLCRPLTLDLAETHLLWHTNSCDTRTVTHSPWLCPSTPVILRRGELGGDCRQRPTVSLWDWENGEKVLLLFKGIVIIF